MTGFGEAAEEVDGVHVAIELRSLNNRYFKAQIRLPDEIAGLEAELEAALRLRMNRGSFTLTARVRTSDAMAAHHVNDLALMAYLDHLEALHARVADRDHAVHIDLTSLLALPGVLAPSDAQLLEKSRPMLLRLIEVASDRLNAMRLKEGHTIDQDLARHRRAIRERLAQIQQRAPAVIDEYHTRLRERIDELLASAELKVDEHVLIREVAVFADRCDINEEVTRLAAHLEQFEQIVAAPDGEPAGRTLDFIAQELLREANTIASKSNDAQISRAIVEVKASINRIKEQVQNIE